MYNNSARYKQLILIINGIVTLLGFLVVLGWIFDISTLKSVIPDYNSMKFNTALGFIFLGTSISLQIFNSNKRRILSGKLLGFIVIAIGTLSLYEIIFIIDLGIDQFFYPDLGVLKSSLVYPGRMAFSSALCFLLIGLFSICLGTKNKIIQNYSQYLLHLVTCISFIAIIGYLYDLPAFYKLSFITSMAIHTSVCFFIISISTSLINHSLGITGVFTGDNIGNVMVRKMFFQFLIAVLILSYIRIQTQRSYMVSVEFGIALFGFSIILTSLFLLWKVSKELNVIDSKKSEAEDSLSRTSKILDSTPDPMIIIDEQGKILLSNIQTENVLGYKKDDLIGLKADSIIPERYQAKHLGYREDIFNSPKTRLMGSGLDLFALKKNGEEIPVEVSLSPIKMGNKTWVSASIRDISLRREEEIKINQLATIIESSVDAIFSMKLDGTVLTWNRGAEMILGYTLDEIVGRPVTILCPPELIEEEKTFIKTILGGAYVDSYETVRVRKDQSIINVSITLSPIKNKEGKIIAVSKILRDISQQKKSELELQESNRRNSIFIQQAPNAIAMFDTEMCYMAASKKWVSDYHLEDKEIIGHSHYEIFPEIVQDWKAIHQECLRGKINTCDEASFERADGSVQWLTWDVRPWYISSGNIGGLIMYTADITQLKENDLETRRIEEILDRTNEIARIGTWEVDLINNTVKWSRITKEIHEVEADYEPELESAINFFKEGPSREMIQKAVGDAITHGTTYDLELELVTAKGNEVWARAIGQVEFENGVCKRLYGVFQDINEAKKSRESLNLLNEELNSILNSGHVSIIVTDKNGLITHFNRGAEQLLQYSASEIIGIHSPELIHVREEVIKRGNELSELFGQTISGFEVFVRLAKQGEHESREWTYVRKDGSKFPVQLVVTAIRNKLGEPIGFLGVAIDISDLKNAEKEMKSLLEISTDQNERLRNFAHIVSHNLRSHSGNIEMLLDLYLHDTPGVADNEYISLLKTGSDNLKETIANLNEVVLVNTSFEEKLAPINLYQTIESAAHNVGQLAKEAAVTIVNEVDKNITILGLSAYADSILLNFISNGIKYRSENRPSKVILSASILKDYVVLKIEDNGLGIDLKKNGAKLFGMYKTFHGNEDARGIGLFITKNQVEALGGKIEVESQLNIGTTFRIYFKHEKN